MNKTKYLGKEKQIGLVIVGLVIVVALFTLIMTKGLSKENSPTMRKINKEEKALVLAYNSEENDISIKKYLSKEKVSYISLDSNKNRDYDYVIEVLGLNKDTIQLPALIYVEEGKAVAYLYQMTEEETSKFLDYYQMKGRS